MFDKHVRIEAPPMYPQDIHEHRAPTDASVKLLSEMEKVVVSHIDEKFIFQDNDLNGSVYTYVDQATKAVHVKIVFSLNGKKHESTIENLRVQHLTKNQAFCLLAKTIAKAICQRLICNSLQEKQLDELLNANLNK